MMQKVTKFYIYLIFAINVYGERTCPESNSDQPEIIPDARNCSRFYICDNGLAFGQHCYDGLYFNPTLKVCDHPENVVYCEYDDFVYIKPHCNCSKYVICNYGTVEVMECAQGYHFSQLSARLTNNNYYNPCDPGSC